MGARSFDLRFRLGSIPVTVEPWFWLSALVLGGNLRGPTVPFWIAVVFVSVLAHEMGHALASRAYGVPATVRLHAFGGHTRPAWGLPRWKSVVMTLAGPGAGFAVGALAWLSTVIAGDAPGILGWCIGRLIAVNFLWGVLNLLPLPPLDGGHVLLLVAGARHRRTAMIAGTALGAVLTAAALLHGELVMALLLGALTFQNVQSLRARTA